MKSKTTAGLLALFLGGFGVHKFYLNRPFQGLLYLIFFWTFIPALIAFVEAIMYFAMSDTSFNAKYNGGSMIVASQPQNIVVNVQNSAIGTSPHEDRLAKLKELATLKDAGHLSAEEFEAEKRRILAPAP